MWQLVGTTVLCTQKEDCLLCQVNISGGNEVLLNIFLVALLVSFPLLCLRHVACILRLLPKMQGFMAKHKLVSDRMAHSAAVGRADLACARMKTGASWRCCWTCAHNGTDQPQLKRLDRGLLRLSSGLGLDKNAQKDRAQKDLGMPTQHTCAGPAQSPAATLGRVTAST